MASHDGAFRGQKRGFGASGAVAAPGRRARIANKSEDGHEGQAVEIYAANASDSAARHLLHNLRNAKALRVNPLVAHLLKPDGHGTEPLADRVVVSRVTQAVAAVLRTLAPVDGNPFDGDRPHRQAEIVRRCVIGTEPYKAVARDLGISLRTLFRDLDGIRLRLVEDLPRYTPPVTTVTSASDTFEFELRHAHLLRNMGRFQEALEVLDRLAAQAASPIQRARAWNTSAIALVDSGATEKAVDAVGRARITLANVSEAPSSSKALLECDVDLTDAMIARVHGDTTEAFKRYDHAAGTSGPLVADNPAAAIDVFVRAQSQFAVLHWLTGNIDTAARAVDSGWNVLERLADPPEAAHYALLAASSMVHLVGDGDLAWAIREMSAAAVLAERHGMLHDALMALGWLAGLERLSGNAAGAVETSRRTIAIARNTMTGTEFGLLCAAAAENEASVGETAAAMRLIEEGRARVTRGGSAWARLLLGEAETLLAAGRHADAIAAAEKAAEAMQRQNKAGFVGYACLVRALAHERRGERAQALLAAREALPLIERFGKSPELVAAYELSARLTGNRAHKATAIELSRLLGG
jgi:tetratricopeptide (TPR) repeat protein